MKKFLFVLAMVVAFATNLTAQSKSHFGIRAGLNIASQKWESNGISLDSDSKLGFHAGFVGDLSLNQYLYFQPGLLFSAKGAKITLPGMGGTADIDAYYLELPLILSVAIPFDETFKLRLNAGPALALGVAGKISIPGYGSEDTFGDENMKRFDCGFTFGGGLDIKQLYLGINYNIGLVNTNTNDNATVKNRNLSITAGYNF